MYVQVCLLLRCSRLYCFLWGLQLHILGPCCYATKPDRKLTATACPSPRDLATLAPPSIKSEQLPPKKKEVRGAGAEVVCRLPPRSQPCAGAAAPGGLQPEYCGLVSSDSWPLVAARPLQKKPFAPPSKRAGALPRRHPI